MARLFSLALLLAILGLAVYAAWTGWHAIGAEIGLHGAIALVLGIGGTLALTAGLLGLMRFSQRRGFDQPAPEAATAPRRPAGSPPPAPRPGPPPTAWPPPGR